MNLYRAVYSKIRAFLSVCYQDGPFTALSALAYEVKRLVSNKYVFKYMTALRYGKQQLLYDAPAHPYKTITVCPDRVEHFNKELRTHLGLGRVAGGGWDWHGNCVSVRSTSHYKGLREHFDDGLDWEHTTYARERLQDEDGGLSDYQRKRLNYFEDLFYDIKRNGYRPNYDSEHDAPEGGKRQGRFKHVHSLEIIVTIGRDGEIYLNEGFHRFAIAKFLEIESLPVHVLARHEEWQDKREMMYAASDPRSDRHLRQYVSHPDMEDVVHDRNPSVRDRAENRTTASAHRDLNK